MTKTLLTLAAAVIMTVPAGAIQAQEATWLHVHVEEHDRTTVRLNLPVALVAMALDVAGREGFDEARLARASNGNVDLDDIRRMWTTMRDAGDAEFIDVQDGDERIRVFRRGESVYVHVDEGDVERVRIEMPVSIADILLGREGEELDLHGAILEMARRGEPNAVHITAPDTAIRIWMDDRSDQDDR